MKVFIVTTGEYSDYHICEVFTTREAAESFLPKAGGIEPEIEEYEADAVDTFEERDSWNASVDMEDGKITRACKAGKDLVRSSDRGASEVYNDDWIGRPVYAMSTSYVSKEHAIKLAVEARQKWLREKGVEG